MARAQKTKSKPPLKEDKKTSFHDLIQILSAVCGLLAVAVAATPVYWSYLCRSKAAFCEGSFSAPAALSENRDRLKDQLSSAEGRELFEGLLIKERGAWPFARRLDVVARFKDGKQITVDTIPGDFDNFELYNNQKDQIAAVISSKGASRNASTQITSYFPGINFTKRVFYMNCGRYEASEQREIQIRNFIYLPASRSMVFDVTSICSMLQINDNLEVSLERFRGDRDAHGKRVTLELTETLHANKAYTAEDRASFELSEAGFAKCRNEAESAPEKMEGELWTCYRFRPSIEKNNDSELEFFEWSQNSLKSASQTSCDNAYWSKDPGRKAIFISCEHPRPDGATAMAFQIIQRPFGRERYYTFEGKCTKIYLWNPRYSSNGCSVTLELVTNCSEITINDTKFAIAIPESGVTRGMYRLELDENWLAVSFGPDAIVSR